MSYNRFDMVFEDYGFADYFFPLRYGKDLDGLLLVIH